MPTRTNGSTDEETSKPSTRTPTSVGTALAKAKELRDAGEDAEADRLLETFFANEAAEKEEAKKQAHVASENLKRLKDKKERHARTHKPKEIGLPWHEPLWQKIKDLPRDEKFVAIGKFGCSECSADFGPPPPNYRGVPQKGTCGTPRVHIAQWMENQISATPTNLEVAADCLGLRVEMKIDDLLLTAREHVVRAWRLMVYVAQVDHEGGDEAAAQAALADFPWHQVPVYDAKESEPMATSEPAATAAESGAAHANGTGAAEGEVSP